MTTYHGIRGPDGPRVEVENSRYNLRHGLLHIVQHSRTGFEWGYGGSGPADLALSILAHHLGEAERVIDELRGGRPATMQPTGALWRQRPLPPVRTLALYQAFKWRFIAGLPAEEWAITSGQIDAWLESQGQEGLI